MYMNHLKTLSSPAVLHAFHNMVIGFMPVDGQRPSRFVGWSVSPAAMWRLAHPGQPFGYVWGTNPHHHIDFVAMALRTRHLGLLQFMLEAVCGRVGRYAELGLLLATGPADDEMAAWLRANSQFYFE
jgi:hypothetical protein